jgi:hypothetical protein
MYKALIAGLLSVNGVSAVALTSEGVYESVPWTQPWDFGFDYGLLDKSYRYGHEEPVVTSPPEPTTDFSDWEQKIWRPYTGKYDFPGRTDWGEDPDHFNWNNGGYASAKQYDKPLDFSTVIRPWRHERHTEDPKEHHEPLVHKEREEFEDYISEFAKPNTRKKNVGGHALGNFNPRALVRDDDPIPDQLNYGDLRWSVKHGLNKLSHDGHDLPPVKKSGYSRFSYLKGADDFGSEDCIGCEDHDHHALDKEDNTKLGNLDPDFLKFDLRRPNYPNHPDDHHAEEEVLSIDPTLDNAWLAREYHPWTQWNPKPSKVENYPDHDHHVLDKTDTTKYGNLDPDFLKYDLRRPNYPTAAQRKAHEDGTSDDNHDRTIFPTTFEADEFAPLGRYFQAGNTDVDKFYNTSAHHSYLPRRPLYPEPHPEILAAADWARHVR